MRPASVMLMVSFPVYVQVMVASTATMALATTALATACLRREFEREEEEVSSNILFLLSGM